MQSTNENVCRRFIAKPYLTRSKLRFEKGGDEAIEPKKYGRYGTGKNVLSNSTEVKFLDRSGSFCRSIWRKTQFIIVLKIVPRIIAATAYDHRFWSVKVKSIVNSTRFFPKN